jgi:hypothetical protein
MSPKLVAWALGLLSLVVAGAAGAEPRPRYALEMSTSIEYGRMIAPAVDHSHELSARNGGAVIGLAASFRSPYFLAPFIDVGYAQLYSSEEQRVLASGTLLRSQNSLSTIWGQVGAGLDVWRLRVRAGLGVYRLRVQSEVLGITITPTELDYGYSLSVSGFFYDSGRLRIGADAHLFLISEAETASVALGLTVAGDAVCW